MKNLEIRLLVMDSGILYRDIAKAIGITPEWLSKCLSKELKPDMRKRILHAIEKLKEKERPGD